MWVVIHEPIFSKTQGRYCICFHHCLAYMSSLTNTPGGMLRLDFISNSILGVSAGGSFGSPLTVVKGMSLIIFSHSVIRVYNCSSVRTCSFASAFRTVCTERIIFSYAPPLWLAHGGLKCNSISCCVMCCSIRDLFHC